jgi:nucleoid-associated protein YgaU
LARVEEQRRQAEAAELARAEEQRRAAAVPAVRLVRPRASAPVASRKIPDPIPPEGAEYTVNWGDTLWDIAAAFYGNPQLYTQIARHNNIPNPNRIISGTTIRIPPRE